MSDWGMTSRQRAELDNYITGHWGENSIAPDNGILGNLYDAARALSDHFTHYGRIVTDETYGQEADRARQLMQNLKDALAEVAA